MKKHHEFLPPNRRGFNQLRHSSISNRLPAVVTPIPIRDAFARYLDEMRASRWMQQTLHSAAILYGRFIRSLGPTVIMTDQLAPEMFKAIIGPNLTPASRRSYAIRFITAINWMVQRGYMGYDAAELCINALHEPRPEPRRPTPALSRDQISSVLNYIPTRFRENPAMILRNTVVFLLLYEMCLRVGELVALRVRDIDLANRVLILPRTAGPSDRLDIPDHVMAALESWLSARRDFPNAIEGSDEPLIPSRSGRWLSADQVCVIVSGMLDDCGQKNTGPRALRRAGAIHKLNAGWLPHQLMKLLRIRNVNTLNAIMAEA